MTAPNAPVSAGCLFCLTARPNPLDVKFLTHAVFLTDWQQRPLWKQLIPAK
jgi:hypothetical protein